MSVTVPLRLVQFGTSLTDPPSFALHKTGVVELNEAAEAYHSRKSEMFAAWDRFTVRLFGILSIRQPSADSLVCLPTA